VNHQGSLTSKLPLGSGGLPISLLSAQRKSLQVATGTRPSTLRPHGLPAEVHLVGKSGPRIQQSYPWSKEYVAAEFDLSPGSRKSNLQSLSGFDPGDLNHATLMYRFNGLHGKTTTEDRLEILRDVAEYWHGPIGPDDGIAEEEVTAVDMPVPLRWWYRLAGRRREIMSGQKHAVEPNTLKIERRPSQLYGENQWVYEWATKPSGDDLPYLVGWNASDPGNQRECCFPSSSFKCAFSRRSCVTADMEPRRRGLPTMP